MTANYRVAAWTLPTVGTSEPIDSSMPIVAATIQDTLDGRGRGTVSVPASYDWQRIVFSDPVTPANNRSALIRIYKAGDDNTQLPVYEFKATRHSRRLLDDGQAVVDIDGPDWRIAGLDEAILRPWDWQDGATSTEFGDWLFGGDDLIDNPTFIGNTAGEKTDVHNDATAGTFTITVTTSGGPDTTGAIAFDANAATVEAAVLGLSNVSDVAVSGAGTAADPWRIEIVDPAEDITLTVDDAGLTGGTSTVDTVSTGGVGDIEPWTISVDPQSGSADPRTHGSHDEPPRPVNGSDPAWAFNGGAALYVNPASQFGGIQQIRRATPGAQVQISFDIGDTVGTTLYRAIIRDINETKIASSSPFAGFSVTANQYNTITYSGTLPDDLPLGLIIFRIAVVSVGNPPGFYIRQTPGVPFMQEGLGQQTVGTIANLVLDDAQTDHTPNRLTWLTRGPYTGSVDSGGANWPRSESVRLAYGRTYGSDLFAAKIGQPFGYEWDVAPVTPTSWQFDVWVPGGRGTDRTATPGPAFIWGYNVGDGDFAGRVPRGARLLAAGHGGLLAEAVDNDLETAFGPTEWFLRDNDITDAVTLGAYATEQQSKDLANLLAVNLLVAADTLRIYDDVQLGDTVSCVLPGLADPHSRRLSTFTLRYVDGRWEETVTASRLFTGQHAINQAVLDLLTEFKVPFDDRPADSPITLGSGGSWPIVVATFDAPDHWKNIATVVLVGDQTDGPSVESLYALGFWVQLSPGTMYVDPAANGGVGLTVPNGKILRGAPRSDSLAGTTILNWSNSAGIMVRLGSSGWLQDIDIDDSTAGVRAVRLSGGAFHHIENCYLRSGDAAIYVDPADQANDVTIAESWIQSNVGSADGAIHNVGSPSGWKIKDNLRIVGGEHAIWLGNTTGGTISHLDITNNDISGADRDAIRLEMWDVSPFASTISRNNIRGGNGGAECAGIHVVAAGTSPPGSNGLEIADNTIENISLGHGVWLDGCEWVDVHDNYIEDCDRNGILVAGADDCTIHHNRIVDNAQEGVDVYDGIRVTNSDRNNITGNTIREGGNGAADLRYGVSIEDSTSDGNIVLFNDLRASGGLGPLNDLGTGTIKWSNVTDSGSGEPAGGESSLLRHLIL